MCRYFRWGCTDNQVVRGCRFFLHWHSSLFRNRQNRLVVVCFISNIISVAELKSRGSCSCQPLPLLIHVSARMSEEESACGHIQSFAGLEPRRRQVLASFRYPRHSRCSGQTYQGAPFTRWDQEFEAREDRLFHHGARDVRVSAVHDENRHSTCRCMINSSHRHKCVRCRCEYVGNPFAIFYCRRGEHMTISWCRTLNVSSPTGFSSNREEYMQCYILSALEKVMNICVRMPIALELVFQFLCCVCVYQINFWIYKNKWFEAC